MLSQHGNRWLYPFFAPSDSHNGQLTEKFHPRMIRPAKQVAGPTSLKLKIVDRAMMACNSLILNDQPSTGDQNWV